MKHSPGPWAVVDGVVVSVPLDEVAIVKLDGKERPHHRGLVALVYSHHLSSVAGVSVYDDNERLIAASLFAPHDCDDRECPGRRVKELLGRVECSRTLHMDGLPTVSGCPGCDARALLSGLDGSVAGGLASVPEDTR